MWPLQFGVDAFLFAILKEHAIQMFYSFFCLGLSRGNLDLVQPNPLALLLSIVVLRTRVFHLFTCVANFLFLFYPIAPEFILLAKIPIPGIIVVLPDLQIFTILNAGIDHSQQGIDAVLISYIQWHKGNHGIIVQ